MTLEKHSLELKKIISDYNTEWFLGDLSWSIKSIGKSEEELKNLSSPMRQLYFLAGLLVTSSSDNATDIMFNQEKWDKIKYLLNLIEKEYEGIFYAAAAKNMSKEKLKEIGIAMPSFFSYFNQGPLNYEEQSINWVKELYEPLDKIIEVKTGLITNDFIEFYNNLDNLNKIKFQCFSSNNIPEEKDWLTLTRIQMGVGDDVPFFAKELMEERRPLYTFTSDKGIIDRFRLKDLVTEKLDEHKVKAILGYLKTERAEADFIYYTATNPGNPLYERPIVDIGDGIFQVFEVKQVIHAIENLLEKICTEYTSDTTEYVESKGDLLEKRIVELFNIFFKDECKIYQGYYIDGNEQGILILWKGYALIIEAKGYNLREPLRDPSRAFIRIKDDFNKSIGYGYIQTKRVEEKFINKEPLKITDKKGNLIEEINTEDYEDFSLIVNLKSFGQIQIDLSMLLEISEDDVYPLAIKFDDLEVFLLTLMQKKKPIKTLIDYLSFRENIHSSIICSDELEICGGFLNGKLNSALFDRNLSIATKPDLAEIFDQQYNKGMGFKNEKYLKEKKGGKILFW